MYQLTPKALIAIDKARSAGIIRGLANALKCSDNTINRHIRDNEPNGDLTKKIAVEVIRKNTGLKEAEILVRVNQPVEA